jgi:hypothetical protein
VKGGLTDEEGRDQYLKGVLLISYHLLLSSSIVQSIRRSGRSFPAILPSVSHQRFAISPIGQLSPLVHLSPIGYWLLSEPMPKEPIRSMQHLAEPNNEHPRRARGESLGSIKYAYRCRQTGMYFTVVKVPRKIQCGHDNTVI